MNLLSPTEIKSLLSKYGIRLSKGLGQNFLIDQKVLAKIIEAAEISPQETILEIGPGIGTLTQKLAESAGKVIAVEKDMNMVEILKETLDNYKNIEIIPDDILELLNPKHEVRNSKQIQNSKSEIFEDYKLKAISYKLVANIPYYITAPLIRALLENENPPKDIILMVQKEVAQRICAKPPEMSLLAVSVQYYAEPKIFSYVSKNCFWPAPKIDSAILKISNIKKIPRTEAEQFFTIVKAGFSHPRKQLLNNLSSALKKDRETVFSWLLKNNIQPKQRAETPTIEDWKNLTNSF